MTRPALAAGSLGLLCAAVVTAAEPGPRAAAATTGGAAYSAAPAGAAVRAGRTTRPRGAAFGSAFDPAFGAVARLPESPVAPAKVAAGYDLVVYAPHRPIRVRVEVLYEGKSLDGRWRAALRRAFDGFDRDRDGYLNGYEVRRVFHDASLAVLIGNGYYAINAANVPTLDKLDADGDRRVSFEEFAAYYTLSAAQVARAVQASVENPYLAQTTERLFELIDRDGDGRLSAAEMKAVEKLMATLDADEDECLGLMELVPNAFDPRPARPVVPGPGQPRAVRPRATLDGLGIFDLGAVLPGVTREVLKQYDTNGDGELSRAETGFDPATFARLDTDQNGTLSAAELDEWRTGPADLDVRLSLAAKAVDCTAAVTTAAATAAARGFTVARVESGKIVVKHGRQPMEFWAFAPVVPGYRVNLRQQWGHLFAQAAGPKGYVEENDFAGQGALQYQTIRVAFDAADANADGRLTAAEYDAYLDLQQVFVDLGVGLTPAIQTPTLFQLLDENRDGRLGVRELRTGFDRLIALEPSVAGKPATAVTRAVIQPVVSARLSLLFDRYVGTQQMNSPFNQPPPPPPQKGPAWFRKMDRNGDGDLSRGEFLGTRAEFDAIDADRDGLISLDEAEAHDRAARPRHDTK